MARPARDSGLYLARFSGVSATGPLVVAFANFEQKKGYRFRGEVVLHTDDAIYDEQVKLAKERGTKVPACVPVLEISEIEDLSAGAKAGSVISHD